MALRQHGAVAVGSGAAQTYVVVNAHCQLRPVPNHDYTAIGVLRNGLTFRGYPHVCAGAPWVKLHDEEAAVYVHDKSYREDGVWVAHTHPRLGKLIQSQEQDVRYGQGAGPAMSNTAGGTSIVDGGAAFGHKVTLHRMGLYEESLQLEWKVTAKTSKMPVKESVLELVIDSAAGRPPIQGKDELLEPNEDDEPTELLTPSEGAIVKRVECGKDKSASLSNMPMGRYFLASVIVTFENGHRLRSRWTRVATLQRDGRDARLGATDPLGNERGKCGAKGCTCSGYVAVRWTMNSRPSAQCRRCACRADDHVILQKAEDKNLKAEFAEDQKDSAAANSEKPKVVELPPDGNNFSERERDLWRWSNGALHPREHPQASRKRKPRKEPEGVTGKVTVVVPTVEDRQLFHEQIWKCFSNQTWPDKEMIVVETYKTKASPVFKRVAAEDRRLIYIGFRVARDSDLSIGSKRNIAMYCADGDYLASFDDDDIYAPTYLETMITELADKRALFITLSTWYFFEVKTGLFGFCDPYAWARAKKLSDKQIYGWLWGYGFSYLHRLQPALDNKIHYPDQNMSEDITFIGSFKNQFGEKSATLLYDRAGIVLHTIHGRNTSNSFALREVPREEVLDTDFADQYDILRYYLEHFPRKDGDSSFILNQVSSNQITKRRYRQVTVHHDGGKFTINCVRGVQGAQLKQSCSSKLRVDAERLKLYRREPETIDEDAGEVEDAKKSEHADAHNTENVDPHAIVYGTWVYGSKEYKLSKSSDGLIHFDGPHARTGRVTGIFASEGLGWAVAELHAPDGEYVGSIRIRYVPEIDGCVSNFKTPTKTEWGKDIIARRAEACKPVTAEVEAAAPSSPRKDDNMPLQDDERLELRATELWVVVTPEIVGSSPVASTLTQEEALAVLDKVRTMYEDPDPNLQSVLQEFNRVMQSGHPAAVGFALAAVIEAGLPEMLNRPGFHMATYAKAMQNFLLTDPVVMKKAANLMTSVLPEEFVSSTLGSGKDATREIDLKVYIDYELGLEQTVGIRVGATVWNVKEKLASLESLDGGVQFLPHDIDLRRLGSSTPLSNAEVVKDGDLLEICS